MFKHGSVDQGDAMYGASSCQWETEARSYFHDPSIVVPYTITDANGRVIVVPVRE